MAMLMMALGPFRFGLRTAAYQTAGRNETWEWEEQQRLGRPPALQYLGPGTARVKLDGTIYPHFAGGLGQVGRMRGLAGTGRPHMLIDGRGKVWGRYCILTVDEKLTVFFEDGSPRRIDFDLDLSAYGSDRGFF